MQVRERGKELKQDGDSFKAHSYSAQERKGDFLTISSSFIVYRMSEV